MTNDLFFSEELKKLQEPEENESHHKLSAKQKRKHRKIAYGSFSVKLKEKLRQQRLEKLNS